LAVTEKKFQLTSHGEKRKVTIDQTSKRARNRRMIRERAVGARSMLHINKRKEIEKKE